jgi:hypothetical protein
MQNRSLIPFLLALLCLYPFSQPLPAAEPEAAPAAPATTEQPPASPSVAPEGLKSSPTTRQWVNWLPPTLPPHEVEWLRDNTVFSLYFPQQLAQGKGSVLLVPAVGQHAAWPDHVRALTEQLPPNGWSVLVITPVAGASPPSAAAGAPEPQSQPSAEADATEPAAQPAATPEPVAASGTDAALADSNMLDVLHAGISLLEGKGQKNTIVIGMGDGGVTAVELAHKGMGTDGSVKGLVLVDMPTLARPAQKLSEIFRLHPLMVLDITHPEGRDAQRVRAGQLKQFEQYYSVQLPEPMADIQQSNDRLARRVRGWLTRYVSGEQKSGPKPPAAPASAAPAGKP